MIRRNTCSTEGCNNPVWAKGKCKSHQKDKPKTIKKKADYSIEIPEDSKKTKERLELIEFYDMLWDKQNKPRKCQVCGTEIFGTNLSLYHDHLLPKEIYPQFKLEERNMLFVCGDCHTKKENGFPRAKHKRAIETAKKELLKS